MSQQALPMKFIYDEEARELVVEFGDGSIVKYFPLDPAFLDPRLGLSDLDPRLAFLDPLNNPRRNRDFVTWADQRIHDLRCSQRGAPTGPWMCNCRRVVKSENIREATKDLNEPATRPVLALQQQGNRQTTLTYPNTGNRTLPANDGAAAADPIPMQGRTADGKQITQV
jgi:hypothetical protein